MSEILRTAREVLKTESEAIGRLIDRLDHRFERAVELLFACPGKIIVTGMGKSGIICRKVASTLSSIGVPAQFLHPAEAIHGDLGIVLRDDVLLAFSNSGETDEILRLVELVKRSGVTVIALTGRPDATLSKIADIAIEAGVDKEACPLDLVPTASTTAALAVGDALAMALMVKRGFGRQDFAAIHPGGSLGRRILRVEDLMHTGSEVPIIHEEAGMADAVEEMTRKGLGLVIVTDSRAKMTGIIVDGDLRRLIQRDRNFLSRKASACANRNPKTIGRDALASAALLMMKENKITSLAVTEGDGTLAGVLHLHDLWRLGIP